MSYGVVNVACGLGLCQWPILKACVLVPQDATIYAGSVAIGKSGLCECLGDLITFESIPAY